MQIIFRFDSDNRRNWRWEVVRALYTFFFGKYNPTKNDFNSAHPNEPIEVEVCFCNFNDEENKLLKEINLLNSQNNLIIKKILTNKKPKSYVLVYDYEKQDFKNLKLKKELNELGKNTA